MAITTKTPVRAVFDASNAAVGLAEFQTDEVVPISHGGTSGNSISTAKLALSLTDSNVRSLFSVSGSNGSYDNLTGIITVTGGLTSVGGVTGTVSNAQLVSSVTSAGLLANTSLTGIPVAPTASAGTNTTQIATTAYVTTAVADLIDSAPGALDTLNELAAAINDDNNFSTTIITQLGNKANTASLTTANVAELTNLYYSNARVYSAVTGNLALKANVVDLTTANVIELNSLYFTEARARQAISTSGCTLSYSNTTGIISFSQGNTDTINEGSTNLYYTNARVYSAVTGNLVLKANLTDKLNVFAATTSAELAGVISDETGTGLLVFNASPTFTGTVNAAEINASGNVTSPFFYSQSDINLKKDLVHVTNALDIVKLLDGYWFKWKNNDADSIGLIAQHVEAVLPMLIGTSPDGSKTVQYNGIITILLEAIKAQQVQIDEIKAKLDEKL